MSPATITDQPLLVEQTQRLYDQGLFLQAYRLSAGYWNPDTDIDSLSIDSIVLAGRLAWQIGSRRLSRWLLSKAYQRAPLNPQARYFSLHTPRRRSDILSRLLEYQREPVLPSADHELLAQWHASHAVMWATLRDFDNAWTCLDKARDLDPQDPWITTCVAEIHMLADHWVEALDAAERAWEAARGMPLSATMLSRCLVTCGRREEAATRIAEVADGSESFSVVLLGVWLLCAWGEQLEEHERVDVIARARAMVQLLPRLTPLPDAETQQSIARAGLDVAELAGDCEEVDRWNRQLKSPYFRTVLNNTRRNPNGRRIRLAYRPVAQKHDTCLPSSLSVALGALKVELDTDAAAAELTYGGTSIWQIAEWLEKRGLAVRHFRVSPESAWRLLERGIPFVISLEFERAGHSVAAVGIDQAAETLLVCDPSYPRELEMLLDGMCEGERPVGPRAMAVAPGSMADLLDSLLPREETRLTAAFMGYERHMDSGDVEAASRCLDEVTATAPDHILTRYLEAMHTMREGRVGESMAALQQMLADHPGCLRFRRSLIHACRLVGNTALLRDVLGQVVTSGRLPGVDATQEWWLPPSTYICQYADLLRFSSTTRPKAHVLLRGLIRDDPTNAEAWHNLADLFWEQRKPEEALAAYRAASCTAMVDEHYARAYCDALRDVGQESEGLEWLEKRVRKLGSSPRAAGPWITWIDALEECGYPERALQVHRDASGRHAESPEFLQFSVPFLSRMGHWEDAQRSLEALGRRGSPSQYHEAAAAYFQMAGDGDSALAHAERWVSEAPHSIDAARQLLALRYSRQGPDASAELAARWSAERPGHDGLETLRYHYLGSGAHDEKMRLLEARTRRNPEDGWAWRELALARIDDYELRTPASGADLHVEIRRLLGECDRTAPEDPATMRVHAAWCEAQGRWARATVAWLRAIEADPYELRSYRGAWACAAGLPAETRRRVLERIDAILAKRHGRLTLARDLAFMIADRFGLAEAEAAVARWGERRDDPEIVDAAAALLMQHGRGRSDAVRAFEMLKPAAARFPYHGALRFTLSRAYQNMGRDRDAQAVLTEHVRRHPDQVAARLRLADLSERQGDSAGAMTVLGAAADVAPLDADVWNARVELLIRLGSQEEARSLIAEAFEKMPENVYWREKAIGHLREIGDEVGAVGAARDGVRIFPDGAYMWFLLGTTLRQSPRLGESGEPERCLRRALALNARLFDAADELAQILAEQHRLVEAEEIIQQIRPLMADASPAEGRLAWLHRTAGEGDRAREEIADTVRRAPWYGWGWRLLLDWIEEDKQWSDARRVLCPAPPEMNTDRWFRVRRLKTIAAAEMKWSEIEPEWDRLARDYPEDVPLHLEYYDELRRNKQEARAAEILDVASKLTSDDPYVQARWVSQIAERGTENDAVDAMLRVWFNQQEQSTWPAVSAWEALAKLNLGERALRASLRRLKHGAQPSLQALLIMASEVMKGEKVPEWSCRDWIEGDPRGLNLMKLLRLIDHQPWVTAEHRNIVISQMNKAGAYRTVRRYWYEQRLKVEQDTQIWSQVGDALLNLDPIEARNFLAGWRKRRDIEMWVVCSYVISIPRQSENDFREIRRSAQEALQRLPHDHTARYLACTLVEMCILLDDSPALRQAFEDYSRYLTGTKLDSEWFPDQRRYLFDELPHVQQRILAEGRPGDLPGMRKRILEQQSLRSATSLVTTNGLGKAFLFVLGYMLFMAFIGLLRSCE